MEDNLKRADYYILEYLNETNAKLTPKCISLNIGGPEGYNNRYIGERCRHLLSKGYLEKIDSGVYIITEDGKSKLEEIRGMK